MPEEVHRCEICGAKRRYGARYHFANADIVRCRDCGFMWLNPQPTKEDLQLVYDDHYFGNEHFFDNDSNYLYGYTDYILERLNKQRHYERLVRRTKSLLWAETPDSAPLRWLDIGCGLGYLLDCAYDFGFEVCGTEVNAYAVRQLRMRYNYRVDCLSVTDPAFDGQRFDAISMTDLIEHLHNPREIVRRMFDMTKPNGIVVVTTMDSDSIPSRLLGKRLEDFRRTREHLYFFSRSSLTRLLREEGFAVISIHSVGHTFALGFLAKRLRLISKPVGDLLGRIVRLLRLEQAQIYVNPRTKMIVYARRMP